MAASRAALEVGWRLHPAERCSQGRHTGRGALDFGDIDFATADTFVQADYSLDRVDVIRGGSAASFASNAPGGIFNFISKTGEVEGGNIGLTRGLDFDRTRLDFDYGRPLGKDWRFHVGGFYRYGEGARTVGYAAENGGQLKGNVTRSFDDGFVRASFKILHDRAPVYLPVPVLITGTASDPQIASLPGFDVLHGAMQSKYFRHDLSVNRNGEVVGTDIADGYYSKSEALGLEAAFDLALWTTFKSKQVDIDVTHPGGQAYLTGIPRSLSDSGIRMVRLDAVGYAIKKPGASCFMMPETFEFIDRFAAEARSGGIEVLVEIHAYYGRQIEIAKRIDWVYDFALPPLVLHAFMTGRSDALRAWIAVRPTNALTVLDTHDGIGIIDIGADPADRAGSPGLVPPHELDALVDWIHDNSGGQNRLATGAAASNLDLYQVNCTFHDALGGDDRAYLARRARCSSSCPACRRSTTWACSPAETTWRCSSARASAATSTATTTTRPEWTTRP